LFNEEVRGISQHQKTGHDIRPVHLLFRPTNDLRGRFFNGHHFLIQPCNDHGCIGIQCYPLYSLDQDYEQPPTNYPVGDIPKNH
tara:strand:- start:74 stop:325 length:252 start_codon:yes stop_codon:yes gene_type:complete